MVELWAERALLPEGWAEAVRVELTPEGRIGAVTPGAEPTGERVELLLPGRSCTAFSTT
jgi:formimidoylglutamate deiminase